MFSESQVKVLLILLDEKGHPGWELAEHIKMKESNLSPVLKKLEKIGIISHEEARDSTRPICEPGTKGAKGVRPKTRSGGYHEFPYYLNKSLEAFKSIIRELKGKKYPHIDAGFVLNIISRSVYIKAMINLFGEEVNKNANEELKEAFPFIQNDFYLDMVADLFPKDLSDFKERQLKIETEWEDTVITKKVMLSRSRSNIEIWYDNYLKSISSDPANNDI